MPDLTDQLRRYADAAEERVGDVELSPAPTATPPVPGRLHRRLLAAAAAVTLLAAGAGLFVTGRDRDQVLTTPAAPAGGECPAPPDRGARIGDLRLALPWVASADLVLSTDERVTYVLDRGKLREVQLTVADFGVEPTDPATNLPNGFARTTVSVCDPFAGSERTQLPAAIISSGGTQESSASLQFHPGGRWTVTMFGGERSEITVDDLAAIAAGMSWSSPNELGATCDAVSTAGTGSLTVTHLPAGHQPESPPAATVAPASATAAVEHYFRRDDGQTISVLWFSADDPASVIRAATGDLIDGQADQRGIAGCLPVSGAYPGWRDGEIQVLVRRTPAGVIAAGQFGTNDGWVVTGGAETSEDEVLAVASGLRP
jgi:hypothetical protein